MNKSKKRRQMIADICQPQHQQIYKERGYRVEPMQGNGKKYLRTKPLLDER